MHTTAGIAARFAAALSTNRPLREWSESHFGKALALRVGVDMRRPPDEADAPFAVFFPDSETTGPGRKGNDHEIGLLIGLSNEAVEDRDGVLHLTGVLQLAECWELARKALEQAVPGVTLGDVSVEYQLVAYPLLMLDAAITATESLPLGRRL